MYETTTVSCLTYAQDPNAKGACAGLYQQTSSSIESLANVAFGSALPIATSNSMPTLVPIGPGTGWEVVPALHLMVLQLLN
ncbi:uncharacterized protein Bfra_009177 [Botrytis fragariae]|uniref:Uncharacterized protein n=1 Tax=Botrytis fragariae TaxID=1964551 RepID=A0A8H6EG32_9HELO|nr:uncharacterized protein Bfra_009177 [Botrytis fragariae]KAF5870630.1 hypothetical protein Bfra_009177 [Botrytis fragariae]